MVQRFEFTYELTHKTLKRFMALTGANPEDIAQMAFSDLIRTGNAQGLLSKDWADWKGFREMRGSTSHDFECDLLIIGVAGRPAHFPEASPFSPVFGK
ncbi:MAG: nucleotidyltransferase substrate binding protein [Burkholderiaceae bacterium]